jgi:hypothetical protein
MSQTLEKILLDNISEMYDGNTISPEYSKYYITNFLKARRIDVFGNGEEVESDTVDADQLYAEMVSFTQHEQDEMTITYDDGQSITIDSDIVKEIISQASVEEITYAGQSIDYMHDLIARIYDEVISVQEQGDGEDE